MDIFISWSGARSLAVAEALRDWLPMVINAAKPFLSVADIDKGARWNSEVAGRLEKSKAGIICLTPGNMESQWLLFEAGALSKTVSNTYVCPLLIGLRPSDVKGPLTQFQFTTTAKADILQLVKTLNAALGEVGLPIAQVDKVFEILWPQLDEQMKKAPPEESMGPIRRSPEDMLEELLERVRNLGRPSPEVEESPQRLRVKLRSKREYIIIAIKDAIAIFLEGYGDYVDRYALNETSENTYLVEVTTLKGFELFEQFPMGLEPTELVLKVRERFAELYKTRMLTQP